MALDLMLDDHAYGLSRRRVTVSTSGLVPAMDRLRERCPVALAVFCMHQMMRYEIIWYLLIRNIRFKNCWRLAEDILAVAPRDFVTFEYVMLDGTILPCMRVN
jgi:23S rRNA (adenine2503-C2)-methyltransferase